MARPRRGVALAAALAALAAPASAQSLPRLHVLALGMRADRETVRVGEVFHLAIHVRVAERVRALDDLVLPDVGTMELLGDERRATRGPAGTDVVETLTLSPTASGRATFAPAYLDAVDGRDGKPMRFSASHPVTVTVLPALAGSGATADDATTALRSTAWALIATLVAVLVAGIALRRRTGRRAEPPVSSPPVAASEPTARERVAAALRSYRVTPGGAALEELRGALFAAAGVGAGATVADALRMRPGSRLGAALVAADLAAFGPPQARDAASRSLLEIVEGWLG